LITNTAPAEKKLTPDFMALSRRDRLTLRSAAMLVTISSIGKGETSHRAWKFPLYLLFMAYMAAPIPVPGSHAIPAALAYGWIRLGLTPRARWAQGEISKKFNHVALVRDYKDYIQEDPDVPGKYRVASWRLAVKANKTAYQDTVEAKRIFTSRVYDLFRR